MCSVDSKILAARLPSSSLPEQALMNQERCAMILKCQRQIEYWTLKLRNLETEQSKLLKLARLRTDARNYWNDLSKEEQMNKEYILAALESDELPDEFDDFSNNGFPSSIRMDRDILLARVNRTDFEENYRDDRVFLPPKLRSDKEVIMKIIPKHPMIVESMELANDEDIFLAVLRNAELPHQMLQHFSDRVRSDWNLMIKLCAHQDGIHSMSFVSRQLRNNKDFILEAIRVTGHGVPPKDASITVIAKPPYVLKYASQRLRNDYDVVLAAVKECGMNLKYASYSKRRTRTIVVAAIRQNAAAFRYCPPSKTRDKIIRDRQLLLETVGKHTPNELCRISKRELVDFNVDADTLLSMLAAGLDWAQIPKNLQSDLQFVTEAVKRKSELFLEISEDLQEMYDVSRSVIAVEKVEDDVLLEATERCPELLFDREAMLIIAKTWWADVLPETLRYSPIEIRDDKEIMLEAIKSDSSMFEFVSHRLSVDHDILMTALSSDPSLLALVPDAVQMENIDVVLVAIQHASEEHLYVFVLEMCHHLWSNREIVLAWLSQGGDWLACISDDFSTDEELNMALLRKNYDNFFIRVDDALVNSKDFMIKAVQVESRFINDGQSGLRHDYDLALHSFSQSPLPLNFYFEDDPDFTISTESSDDDDDDNHSFQKDFQFLVEFAKTVRRKIDEHENFQQLVVGCTTSITGCPSTLSVLNQGPETVQHHLETMSAYLGLPNKEELAMLRKASTNLLKWGL